MCGYDYGICALYTFARGLCTNRAYSIDVWLLLINSSVTLAMFQLKIRHQVKNTSHSRV